MARWLETLSENENLSEYDFEVVLHLGTNTNADSLSRMPCSQCRLPPKEDSEDYECVLANDRIMDAYVDF